MDAPSELGEHWLNILDHLSGLIARRAPLPELFRALSEAALELTHAHSSLFIYLPPSRPAEYYGSPEALPLGPSILRALRETPAESSSSPATLTIPDPFSTANALTALAAPIFHGKTLGGALTVLYETPPDNPPAAVLSLLSRQAYIAVEHRRLAGIVSESYTGTIRALASAIDTRDPSTHRHSQAVTELAVAFAEALGLSEQEVNAIRHAAILHDIGKIGIGEEILFKRGPLTPRERLVVESHPLVGISILAGIPHLEDLIPLIRHHHERYDGSGYPDGLRDGEIPLGAQVLAIADTFDAITTERPYHRALSIPEACAFLQQSAGTLFDPDLVDTFVQMIRQRLDHLNPQE